MKNIIYTMHISTAVNIILICFALTKTEWIPEGNSHSFTCEVTGDKLNWGLTKNGIQNVVYACSAKTVPECQPLTTELNFDANFIKYSTNYKSVFTIKNVTYKNQNEVTIFCTEGNSKEEKPRKFEIYVFVIPERPTCENITLNKDVNIQINCMTEKSLPEAKCEFYKRTNNTEILLIEHHLISHTTTTSSLKGYNKTECTYTASADIVGPGYHEFSVFMYSNIPSNISDDMKRKSTYIEPITIGYPKAALGFDCKVNDYIKENVTRNCSCIDDNITFLPTNGMWAIKGDDVLDREILTFIAKRPSNQYENNWTCKITNKLNWKDQIEYHPKVAYGPYAANLTFSKNYLDLCEFNDVKIVGTCFVGNSFPKPSVFIKINNLLFEQNPGEEKNAYIFKKKISAAGIYNVSCLAVNSAFGDMYAATEKLLYVKGPPQAPQIGLKRNDGTIFPTANELQVTEGLNDIFCQAIGGLPVNKSISLACGASDTNTSSNVDIVVKTFNVSRSTENIICTCVVSHESKCLQSNTTVYLRLNFGKKTDVTMIAVIVVSITGVCVLILMGSIVLLKLKYQYLLKSIPWNTFGQEVDNTQLYFIDVSNSSSDCLYPYYTNVVTTITSATTVPGNLKLHC